MGAVACHDKEASDDEDGPSTHKSSGNGSAKSQGIAWGFSSMRGWRATMEDAHLALPSLGRFAEAGSNANGWDATALFGVMDGHGGAQVARFCEQHLPFSISQGRGDDVAGALAAAFMHMDELLSDPTYLSELRAFSDPGRFSRWTAHPFTIGCTACVCCVRQDSLVVANAGDSRAVLCRGGRFVDLSKDHKPDLPEESSRIRRAGGWVETEESGHGAVHRVNGDLSLSRAIGDLEYKQNVKLPPTDQLIVATPDVRVFPREPSDEFVLVACDGVWDVMSSREVVDFIRPRLGSRSSWSQRLSDGTLEPSSILEELLDHCISPDLDETDGLGGDNMTAVLLLFIPPERALRSTSLLLHGRDGSGLASRVIVASQRLPGLIQHRLSTPQPVVSRSYASAPTYVRR
mmetsp:Transcript_95417/g.269628  ORF Transcript_95417/g.269628 Transcript_95417/m.269628 type:complete len:404 (+) Transcript_95417:46-1257(+)